jgi:hypothetical protein
MTATPLRGDEAQKKKARIKRAFEFMREVSDRDQAVLV